MILKDEDLDRWLVDTVKRLGLLPAPEATYWYWRSVTPRASWYVKYFRSKADDRRYHVGLYKRDRKTSGPYRLVREWKPATRKERDRIVERLNREYPPSRK